MSDAVAVEVGVAVEVAVAVEVGVAGEVGVAVEVGVAGEVAVALEVGVFPGIVVEFEVWFCELRMVRKIVSEVVCLTSVFTLANQSFIP